jgi:uncharacterized damage-inducible protein DinB
MFRTVSDFDKEWKEESDNSLKMLRALTDASLEQSIKPDFRSLGRLAWHLVQSQVDILTKTGLSIEGPDWDAPIPATAADIAATYERVATAVGREVREKWTDATLLEEHDLYGMIWANGYTLEILIRHEAHHRGQMTVLMRQAGLAVPGPYGPAKEEWAAYGMPPME